MIQQAARIAGVAVTSDLLSLVRSASNCNKLAANSTAYGILKSHYSSQLTSYIGNDSYWSEAFNNLMLKMHLKAYLYHKGNLLTSLNGNWKFQNAENYSTFINMYVGEWGAFATATNNPERAGYTKLYFTVSNLNGTFRGGTGVHGQSEVWEYKTQTTSSGTISVTMKTVSVKRPLMCYCSGSAAVPYIYITP